MSPGFLKDALKRLWKRMFRLPITQWTLGAIVAYYLRFVRFTSRVEFIGDRAITENPQGVIIGAFWHDRLALIRFLWESEWPLYVLTSPHADGSFISKIVEILGVKTIKGSTGHEGVKAFRTLMTALQAGAAVGISPDGPRGPRHKVSEGIVRLSQIMQVPIVPMSYDITAKKTLRSWDKLIVPLPFGHCVYGIGEPIAPLSTKATPQERANMCEVVEQKLQEITQACACKLEEN